MKSKRATKATVARIYCNAIARKANTHEIANLDRRASAGPKRSVSFQCLLRQVSSLLPRNCGPESTPRQGESPFLAVGFMARQLHGHNAYRLGGK
jgi:hypothetical protein